MTYVWRLQEVENKLGKVIDDALSDGPRGSPRFPCAGAMETGVSRR
jgi:hypothetical protein